jgi:hypothetical protein
VGAAAGGVLDLKMVGQGQLDVTSENPPLSRVEAALPSGTKFCTKSLEEYESSGTFSVPKR